MQKASGPRHRFAFRDNYLAAIGVAVFLLSSLFANAQIIQYPNPGLFGLGEHRRDLDSTFYFPTGCGIPTDSTFLHSYGFTGHGQIIKRAAKYYDSCGHHEYVWDPSLKQWHRTDSSAGSSGGYDSAIMQTKYRSDTSRANIYAGISGRADTTGGVIRRADTANKWVSSVKWSNDSLYYQKNGVWVFIHVDSAGGGGITYPNTANKYLNGYGNFPPLNTDSIAQGSANKFFVAADTTNLSHRIDTVSAKTFNLYVVRDGQPGDTLLRGSDSTLHTAAQRDSLDHHHVINPDKSWTNYVQAHDTLPGANRLLSGYQADTARANIYAALGNAVHNGGNTPQITTGLLSARPSATGSGNYFITQDTKTIYRDSSSGGWSIIGSSAGGGIVQLYSKTPVRILGTDTVTVDTLSLDAARLPDIANTQYAVGISASNSIANYPATGIRYTPYKISSTAYGGGTYYGAWLTSNLTGDSVLVYLPIFGVVFGDSQAEGNPGRYGRLTGGVGGPGFIYNYPDSDGQVSYILRQLSGFRWYNHGIGGQTTVQMMTRFARDVLGQTVASLSPSRTLSGPPKIVFIIAGINDIGNGISLPILKTNLVSMVSQASAAGIYTVVCTLPGQTAFTDLQSRQIDSMNTWIKSGVFGGLNSTIFDYGNQVWRADAVHGDNFTPSTLIGPPIHPTMAGYDSLAARAFRVCHIPVLQSVIVTNELSAGGFSGYSRPTGFTVQGTGYVSSHSTDTIPVTVPLTLDSVWVKVTSSTNITGTANTGFSGIGGIITNVVGKGSYTKITSPTSNQSVSNGWKYPQSFLWTTQTANSIGKGIVANGTIIQSANGDSSIQFDFRNLTYSNPSAYALSRNFSMGLTGDMLINGMRLGSGLNSISANTVFGANAGSLFTTGGNNTSIGANALASDTSGNGNTAIGVSSQTSTSNGTFNTSVGMNSLLHNAAGSNNSALGYQAMAANTSGTYNVGLGVSALTANTSGQFNVAAGYLALGVNTTGIENTALGTNALQANTGSDNTAIGSYAGQGNTSGTLNLFAGVSSGIGNTTGNNNTFLGVNAGGGNTTGNNNIVIGSYSNPVILTGNAQLNLGNVIYGTGLYATNSRSSVPTTNGSIGIGLTTPTARLHLPAGTATAGTAPLKLTSGTNLTTTEAGAIEYDGSHLYFTAANAGTRYQLDQQGGFTNPMTTIGDIIYGGASGVGTRLAGNTTTTRQFYTSTGTGSAAQAPTLGALVSGDIPNNAANTSGTAANLSGTPALPNGVMATTQSAGDNSTKLGTTGYTDAAIAAAKPKKFAMTADASVNNTTTPTSLIGTGVGSMTIAANTLVVGSVITFKGSGTINTAATAPGMSFNLLIGTSGNSVTPTIGTSLNNQYEFQLDCIVRTSGTSGTVMETGWISIAGVKTYFTNSAFALDTTVGNLVDLVLTMSGTVGSGDVVTTKTASLNVQ